MWLAWCATAAVGVAGYALLGRGREVAGLLLLALFAALGLLGLAHYHLAPMANHTLAMNATIGTEVATGTLLLLAVLQRLASSKAPPAALKKMKQS